MKKIIFLVLSVCLFIHTVSTQSLDYIKSGEYAFYLDKRGEMNFFRGYLLYKMENNNYFVISRNLNLDSLKSVNYIFTLEEDEKGELSVAEVTGLTKQTPPEYAQGLYDFLNHNLLYQNNKASISYDSLIKDPWDTYTLTYHYNTLLPFFQFLEILHDSDASSTYTLNTAGFLKYEDSDSFFTIEPFFMPTTNQPPRKVAIPSAKKTKVHINGLEAVLDENWQSNKLEKSPSYWLAVETYRDSQLTVELLPEDFYTSRNLTNEDIVRHTILTQKNIDYRSVKGSKRKNNLSISYTIYDENNKKNYQYFFTKDNQVLNFSTFADIFDSNPQYFDAILKPLIQ